MKVYSIWCEYDMGFSPSYETQDAAIKAINGADWSLCDLTLKEVIAENLVEIHTLEVSK